MIPLKTYALDARGGPHARLAMKPLLSTPITGLIEDVANPSRSLTAVPAAIAPGLTPTRHMSQYADNGHPVAGRHRRAVRSRRRGLMNA
ncbi:MAG: hypothetical protein ACREP9_17355, partial [Candidatus Dormibacteraceae bacterium]